MTDSEDVIVRLASLVDRDWKAAGPDDVLLVRALCGAVRAALRDKKAIQRRAARVRKEMEIGRMDTAIGRERMAELDQLVDQRRGLVVRACREIYFNALWRWVPERDSFTAFCRTHLGMGVKTFMRLLRSGGSHSHEAKASDPRVLIQEWIDRVQRTGIGQSRSSPATDLDVN